MLIKETSINISVIERIAREKKSEMAIHLNLDALPKSLISSTILWTLRRWNCFAAEKLSKMKKTCILPNIKTDNIWKLGFFLSWCGVQISTQRRKPATTSVVVLLSIKAEEEEDYMRKGRVNGSYRVIEIIRLARSLKLYPDGNHSLCCHHHRVYIKIMGAYRQCCKIRTGRRAGEGFGSWLTRSEHSDRQSNW